MQAWTLAAGIGCGILAHMASRIFTRSMGKVPSSEVSHLEKITNFPFSMDNKMVLIVRTDLQMGKGKAAAQCAHAAVDLYKKGLIKCPKLVRNWEAFFFNSLIKLPILDIECEFLCCAWQINFMFSSK